MDPIVKKLLESKHLAESERVNEAVPPEFQRSIKEMTKDLQSVINSCDMFEEGFAEKELKQVKSYCQQAYLVLKMIR